MATTHTLVHQQGRANRTEKETLPGYSLGEEKEIRFKKVSILSGVCVCHFC
jgi:hypothetical protein